jgi:hypothetical protein
LATQVFTCFSDWEQQQNLQYGKPQQLVRKQIAKKQVSPVLNHQLFIEKDNVHPVPLSF